MGGSTDRDNTDNKTHLQLRCLFSLLMKNYFIRNLSGPGWGIFSLGSTHTPIQWVHGVID